MKHSSESEIHNFHPFGNYIILESYVVRVKNFEAFSKRALNFLIIDISAIYFKKKRIFNLINCFGIIKQMPI
jgi:hypothetical protein